MLLKTQMTHVLRLPWQQADLPCQAVSYATFDVVPGHLIYKEQASKFDYLR